MQASQSSQVIRYPGGKGLHDRGGVIGAVQVLPCFYTVCFISIWRSVMLPRLFVMVLCLSGLVAGQELSADRVEKLGKAMLAATLDFQKARLEVYNQQILACEGEMAKANHPQYGNRRTAPQVTKQMKQEIKRLEALRDLVYDDAIPLLEVRTLATGQAGYLGSGDLFTPVKVMQVLQDSRILISCGRETLILTGVKTTDVTDGKVIDLPGPVEVIGTESYKTVTGASNTVFVIRGMPSHEWEQVREYLKKNLPGKPLKLRKWTDLAGKVLVEAE